MAIKYYYPELEYYFYDYWKTFGESTIYEIKIPDVITSDFLISENSFFSLLFNNGYYLDNYNYLMELKNAEYCSKNIRERLGATGIITKVYFNSLLYTSEESKLDIFGIEGETESLLDLLLLYRQNGYCSLDDIVYEDLTKCLSKLIYQYLDFIVNSNYERLNTDVVQSDPKDILCGFYELYLVNEAYRITKDSSLVIQNNEIILRPERNRCWADDDTVEYNRFTIDKTPYDSLNFWFFINGELIPRTVYDVIIDSTSYTVDWNGSSITVEKDDVLINDFYVEVNNDS